MQKEIISTVTAIVVGSQKYITTCRAKPLMFDIRSDMSGVTFFEVFVLMCVSILTTFSVWLSHEILVFH